MNSCITHTQPIPANYYGKNNFIFSFGTMFKKFSGFHIFIGEPTEFPVLADRGTLLDTGRETNIDISGAET